MRPHPRHFDAAGTVPRRIARSRRLAVLRDAALIACAVAFAGWAMLATLPAG